MSTNCNLENDNDDFWRGLTLNQNSFFFFFFFFVIKLYTINFIENKNIHVFDVSANGFWSEGFRTSSHTCLLHIGGYISKFLKQYDGFIFCLLV